MIISKKNGESLMILEWLKWVKKKFLESLKVVMLGRLRIGLFM